MGLISLSLVLRLAKVVLLRVSCLTRTARPVGPPSGRPRVRAVGLEGRKTVDLYDGGTICGHGSPSRSGLDTRRSTQTLPVEQGESRRPLAGHVGLAY